MPERSHAKNFNRKLDPAEAQILGAAGNRPKTEGFLNPLILDRQLHNLGFRSDMHLSDFLSKGKN